MKNFWKVLLIIFTVCFFLVLICYLLNQTSYFKVKKIIVYGNKKVQIGEIIKLSGIKKNTGIFNIILNLKKIEKKIERDPLIKKANIEIKLPDEVKLKIKEREGIAFLIVEHKAYTSIYEVDEEGYVISEGKILTTDDLPVITGLNIEIAPGMKIREKILLNILKVLTEIDKEIYKFTSYISEINIEKKFGIYRIKVYIIPWKFYIETEGNLTLEKLKKVNALMVEIKNLKDVARIILDEEKAIIKYRERIDGEYNNRT